MKNFIFLGLAAVIVSCTSKPKEATADNRIEITPFIVTQVIIQDTTQERTDSGKVAPPKVETISTEWISEKQFSQLEKAVWCLVKDPKSKVYVQLTSATPSTKEEVSKRMVECDSVQQSSFDAQGNEIITSMWNCDSTSAVSGIRMIRFCESWYFNPETNMMEKEILGYSLLTYVPSKQAFKPLFYVYRDEEAYKTAKKNDFY